MTDLTMLFLLREIVFRLHVLDAHVFANYRQCWEGACEQLQALELDQR